MDKVNNSKKIFIIILSYIILIFLTIFLCTIGSVKLTFNDILRALFLNEESVSKTIIMDLRLPRNLIAVFCGAALSVSGLLLQAVMRNPLADPGITGISSGASLVAIFILLVMPSLVSFLPLLAFFGGAVCCFFVYIIAYKNGITPIRIILSGVAINAMIGGIISFLTLLYSDKIQSALLWLNGSLSGKNWRELNSLVWYLLIGFILSIFCIRPANILCLGDKIAISLGINLTKVRILISAVAIFLAGIVTSVVGIISFVGLIVPHISKMIVGSDYKYCLFFSMSLGGIVLLISDTLARTVGGSVEIPVGIIMSLLGAPFFLYLLRDRSDYR